MPESRGRLTGSERSQLIVFASVIVLLHLVGWALIWAAVTPIYPFMWGFAGLAYTFGLRHAFDADHIAAIDNTTRKLMEGESRPFGVGFFFSLGHSTVVFVMTLAIALATRAMSTEMPRLRATGAYVGTTVSGLFLYVIGIINLVILIDIVRVFVQARRGEYDPAALEERLLQRGWFTRWFGGAFRLVRRPRQMYWVGLLFGLGFDTASEIGLLTTAGVASSQALPLWAVLLLPLIFAAGMSLVDSADGILMCGAYGWAFANPLRKIFYNITITGLSVAVALFVGTIELLSIVAGGADGHPAFPGALLRVDSQQMGMVIAALFISCWAVSFTVWRLGGFEKGRRH
ncbi:MAG TPA: HoxN/HupN/NixA family nickel/cobalt transporter [Vicinamibacterales bacterium]|jgi:high-affinity nickel-transport protein